MPLLPRRFLVTIHYREPTYERRVQERAARLHPFRASFEIRAGDMDQAREAALAEFRAVALESGSGWVRKVVRVDCEALGEDVVCREMVESR